MTPYAALIPIKDHSERVPGKNFRAFSGKPLWMHIVTTLSAMEEIGAVYIDTDSPRLTPETVAEFPKVKLIARPPELCGDFVSTNRIFAFDLTQVEPVYTRFLQTHTTNPLLDAATIRQAITSFEEALAAGSADSLFSVTRHQNRFYWIDGRPVNHNPAELIRTQDLPPLMEENSNLYLFTRDSFAATNARIGARPMLFEIDPLRAIDIDDMAGWTMAERISEGMMSDE